MNNKANKLTIIKSVLFFFSKMYFTNIFLKINTRTKFRRHRNQIVILPKAVGNIKYGSCLII